MQVETMRVKEQSDISGKFLANYPAKKRLLLSKYLARVYIYKIQNVSNLKTFLSLRNEKTFHAQNTCARHL